MLLMRFGFGPAALGMLPVDVLASRPQDPSPEVERVIESPQAGAVKVSGGPTWLSLA